MKLSRVIWLSCFLFLLASCASTHSFKVPGADITRIQSIYVNTVTNDNEVGRTIANQLKKMGYKTSHGLTPTPPVPVDAIITYEDKWKWDMTMYLLKLTIRVRDGATNQVLAIGESYQPSLQRESVEAIVEKVLVGILRTQAQ